MRKIILAVFMVIILAVPCFSQEVGPEGLFSFEGTRWKSCGIEVGFTKNVWPTPYIFNLRCSNISSAYHGGSVYLCDEGDSCSVCESCEYPEPVKIIYDTDLDEWPRNWSLHLGRERMQPFGIGYYEGVLAHRNEAEEQFYFSYIYAIYYKVEDGWTPQLTNVPPSTGIPIDEIVIIPPDETDPGGGGTIRVIPIPGFPDDIYDDPSVIP